MGYGEIQIKNFRLALRLAAGRLARRAVRADDLAKITRIPIFTKDLFRKLSPAGRGSDALRDSSRRSANEKQECPSE
jgi:hypothetical protein